MLDQHVSHAYTTISGDVLGSLIYKNRFASRQVNIKMSPHVEDHQDSCHRFDFCSFQGSAQVHIPLALGAIAVFHSVPTGEIGGESLKLDACLLAKIFGGAITTWDHADIKAYLGDKQVVCDANKRAAHG